MPSIKRQDKQVVSDGQLDAARHELETVAEQERREFEEEWTKEVTDERLRDWNDACISHRFGIRTTQWSYIRQYEAEVGYTYEDLLSAVLYHYADQYGDAAWVLPTNAAMTQVQRPRLGSKRIFLGPPIGHNITPTSHRRGRPIAHVVSRDYS